MKNFKIFAEKIMRPAHFLEPSKAQNDLKCNNFFKKETSEKIGKKNHIVRNKP